MDTVFAGTSTNHRGNDNQQDNEMKELSELTGINVWGEHQEVLEEQALEQLEIFNRKGKEDGEISEPEPECPPVKAAQSLDINSYIKRQEELRKHRENKRSSQVSEKSKRFADEISKRQAKEKLVKRRGRKRKVSEEESIKNKRAKSDENENLENNNKEEEGERSGSEYVPSDPDSDYEPGFKESDGKCKVVKGKRKKNAQVKKVTDDGSEKCYKERLKSYYDKIESEMERMEDDVPADEDVEICEGFKISGTMWNKLYGYQQDGLEWLWELQKRSTGGLLGDEMGLGKTVQIIAFLYALNYSRVVSKHGRYTGLGPTIIVCPSTVIHQWVKHFHEWAPEFRVAVLHQSGSYTGNKTQLIKDINKNKGIIVTTYQAILRFSGVMCDYDWHYVILDEGHKIRNSGAKISVAVKKFRTPHRIILTGSPMQNNLQELWSLFDFINPGMLGTLAVFLEHFANPIMQGGYANATQMQEALALSMATALKNMISPYLLRRAKADVKQEICLPNKSEQVLFCSLTKEQRDLYKGYLMSEQVSMVLGRGGKNWFSENHTRANVLMSITTLRKICNHPDIYLKDADEDTHEDGEKSLEDRYGYYKRSGKMIVVSALLKIWKKQTHRVLLFTQSRVMISIFQDFLEQNNYKYLKMDGSTAIASRQPLIDKFNQDSSYDVFLLTTRVGGLGINLTGANRVIIYDPDWNPATDTQARERAWRIGQEKQVTIYRLLSAGTIEEKMYQRQVWKQLLSNKVLLDPKTQRFFKTSDLHDLFSLQEEVDSNPETANIFKNSRISMEEKIKEKKSSKSVKFSEDKIEKMRQLASQIAKNISSSSGKRQEKKDPLQLELEEERKKKLEEKAVLKTMTAPEIIQYNREKANKPPESPSNKIDECETDVSFTKALVISEKTAELYHEAKADSSKIDAATEKYSSLTNIFAKKSKKVKKDKSKVVDTSGEIEGEKVDGLLKLEVKKVEKSKSKLESQDNYVLGKLFSKKGVGAALQHDTIVQGGVKEQGSIRLHSETKNRTDLALAALRKSRASKWRW